MGTHPIFESDFDCLTVLIMSNHAGIGYEKPGSSRKKKDDKEYQFYGSVDDRGRRTWDTKAYEQKAKTGYAGRDGLSADAINKAVALSDKRNLPPGQRDLLRAREYKVDLDSRLNKTSVVTANDNRDGAGYYCEVCDCVIKDSMNFLDHINGKKHIQNLGMSMKLKKSTVEDVKARFELNKQKRQEKVKEYSLKERLQDAKEEQERMAAYSSQVRKDKRDRKRRKEDEKFRKEQEIKRAKRAMEAKVRADHEALIAENKRKADEDNDDPDVPPPPPPREINEDLQAAAETNEDDMMAMMGFGGFGGSAKE